MRVGELAERARHELARRTGYTVKRSYPRNVPDEFRAEVEACGPYTLTGVESMFALAQATRFVVARNIPGALVEAGVWKGGSALLMARTLLSAGVADRDLWLYDTFTGMSEPTAHDGAGARNAWAKSQRLDHNEMCFAPIDQVRATMDTSGYPRDRIHLVQGKVEDTIPDRAPSHIALLRLDTDWYESTRHELEHLWPRLSRGGVLIVDDYGHWEGSRRATDEFFAEQEPILMHRIDSTGVLIQKQ